MKTRHVLAGAGLLAAAAIQPVLAQSNVTIYGVIDMFIGRTNGGGDITALDGRGGLSGSRLGFRGSEDLGKGLKALWAYELSISPDTGTGAVSSRQSWLGLQGNWGTASGGFQYAPGYLVAPRFDPLEGSGLIAPRAPLAVAGDYTISSGSRARWSNSVRYESPDFNGLVLQGIFANHNDEDSARPSGDDRWGLGATFKRGPLDLGLVYHNVGAGIGVRDSKEAYVAASYDFRVVRVMGTWQKKEAAGSTSADSKLYSIGFVLPVTGATAIEGGFARLDRRGGDADGNSATVGAIHHLSKRTSLYAAYNRLHYDDGAVAAPLSRAGIQTAVDAGETAHTLLAGIRHKF